MYVRVRVCVCVRRSGFCLVCCCCCCCFFVLVCVSVERETECMTVASNTVFTHGKLATHVYICFVFLLVCAQLNAVSARFL